MMNLKRMHHRGSYACLIVPVFILSIILSACAEKGPVLLAIGYQAPAKKAGTASTISVGVSPFRDDRGKPASVLGKRTIPSGMRSDFIVQGTVAENATAIMKNALAARGIAVKDIAGWDLTVEGMNAPGADILLGGEIKALWLESSATPMQTHVNASVQLRITVGDPGEKKIIRTIDVNSSIDQDILYSQERLEAALNEALSSAVDQMFQDDEMKKRLR